MKTNTAAQYIGRRPEFIEYGHNCRYDNGIYEPQKGDTVLFCPNGTVNLEAVHIGIKRISFRTYDVLVCEGRIIYVREYAENVIQENV